MNAPTRRSLSALALVLAIGAAGTGMAPARAGTLTLESLPAEQQSRLWQRLDQLAYFESGARVCGRPTNLDSRLQAVARDCLTPEALNRVLSTFRSKRDAATKTFDRAVYCDRPEMPTILASFQASTEDLVGRVSGMCKACMMTGMCK